ncbi:DNA cytosine methyltransferase [Xanthomonas sp. WHRI 8370]
MDENFAKYRQGESYIDDNQAGDNLRSVNTLACRKLEIRGDDHAFLRDQVPPMITIDDADISLVDLFCGAGGITLGIVEACRSLGKTIRIPLAVDFEKTAHAVYKANFPAANAIVADVRNMFNDDLEASEISTIERELAKRIGKVDILVGGPPCQGHSDLNNYSRRNDPKNDLYFVMARAAKILKPSVIFIENVLGAKHDKGGVVDKTIKALAALGYAIDMGAVDLIEIGVAQRRRRLVILASLGSNQPDIKKVLQKYALPSRGTAWAIKDLECAVADSLANTPSTPSKDNKKRIDHLFDNEVEDLPDSLRPPCHQHGNHSYKSVYGKLSWNEPSQTITSGFYSMCMGRYVHPSQRRTLTAREAARLQFFPDYFSFETAGSRTAIAKLIGNAVPPKLSYVFAHSLFGY